MSQTPKQPPQQHAQRAAVSARRHATRREREQHRQRQIMLVSGAAIGLALLVIIAGVVYDQLWLPSRPVAQVGTTLLTRSDYLQERRAQSAATVGQSLFLATFGEQFAQQFLGQVGQLDAEIPQIKTSPVDESTVGQWADRQIIIQRAASQFGIEASDAAIAQALVSDYGMAFGQTDAVTPTVGALPTLAPLDSTPAPAETAAATVAAGALADATPAGPTATPAPTETPPPTPEADAALRQQETVLATMYERYTAEIRRIDPQRRPQLGEADFRDGLQNQFKRQVLVREVQQQLVPDETFSESPDPSSIATRHILLKVSAPTTGTDDVEQAFASRRAEAQALLEQARGGADFAALAQAHSEDYGTRDLGGELPGFDPTGKTTAGTQIDPAIVAAVTDLEPGQVAPELVRTPFGWHIVQLVDRTFDTRDDQLQRARTEAFDAWLAEQRAALSVQRFPALSPTPTALPTGTPAALPTQPLGADPSPTMPPTPTLIATPTALAPTPATPEATAAATVTPAP